MKKLLWIALLFCGFSFAQTSTEDPASPEEMLAACQEQAKTLPQEAVETFNQTCSCLAETIDFDKLNSLKQSGDENAMAELMIQAMSACGPQT